MKRLIILSAILISFFASACTFSGDVYVMIAWDETVTPPDAAFFHNIPNVPATFAAIDNGFYYKTTPNDASTAYAIAYAYSVVPIGPFGLGGIVLTANKALLGNETAYYDIRIYRNGNPTLKKVPSLD